VLEELIVIQLVKKFAAFFLEAKIQAPATIPRPGSAQTSPRFPIAFVFEQREYYPAIYA
jgi:hypothetical protein